MITRREFSKLAVVGLALPRTLAAAGIDSRIAGVRVGVQTYSFRALPRPEGGDQVDAMIDAMKTCGIGECEVWSPMVEPRVSRDELRKWRLEAPLDHFRAVKKKFDAAGITIYAWNYSPDASFTDAEIERGFEQAKALGADIITSSTTLEVAKRIAPLAE